MPAMRPCSCVCVKLGEEIRPNRARGPLRPARQPQGPEADGRLPALQFCAQAVRPVVLPPDVPVHPDQQFLGEAAEIGDRRGHGQRHRERRWVEAGGQIGEASQQGLADPPGLQQGDVPRAGSPGMQPLHQPLPEELLHSRAVREDIARCWIVRIEGIDAIVHGSLSSSTVVLLLLEG